MASNEDVLLMFTVEKFDVEACRSGKISSSFLTVQHRVCR